MSEKQNQTKKVFMINEIEIIKPVHLWKIQSDNIINHVNVAFITLKYSRVSTEANVTYKTTNE